MDANSTVESLKIGVVGAGATGAYLAGRLAHAGFPVTLLARGESLNAIRAKGIRIEGPGQDAIRARPSHVVARGESVDPVELVLFCVKSYDTGPASAAAAPMLGAHGRLLCLQNGVENEATLGRIFGPERVMAGVLYIGAARTAPGVVRCSAPPRAVFGPTHASNRGLAARLKAAFERAAIPCEMDENIIASKWRKFLFNCGLNPLTALIGKRLGAILATAEGMALFEGLLAEAVAAARASGAPIPDDAQERVMAVARRMDISSSMAEDLAAGRPIELDAFTGHVVRLGRQAGIPTPVTETVHRLLATAASGGAVPQPCPGDPSGA